jgi:hypothetical protein
MNILQHIEILERFELYLLFRARPSDSAGSEAGDSCSMLNSGMPRSMFEPSGPISTVALLRRMPKQDVVACTYSDIVVARKQ